MEVIYECMGVCNLSLLSIDTRKVYGTEVIRDDHLYRKDDGSYSTPDYEAHPEQYASNFADKVTYSNVFHLILCVH